MRDLAKLLKGLGPCILVLCCKLAGPLICLLQHVYTHTHTYTHNTHTCTFINTHTHARTYSHTTHTQTHANTRRHTHTHTHTENCKYLRMFFWHADLVYVKIKAKTKDALLRLIEREREGELVDRALIKNILGVFIEVRGDCKELQAPFCKPLFPRHGWEDIACLTYDMLSLCCFTRIKLTHMHINSYTRKHTCTRQRAHNLFYIKLSTAMVHLCVRTHTRAHTHSHTL